MEIEKDFKKFEKEIEHEAEEVVDYIKEPKHIKILQIIVILIGIGPGAVFLHLVGFASSIITRWRRCLPIIHRR